MKCVTSSAVRPSTTGALSASARWRCFPPNSGDAWLLDPSERLAVRLARDGDPDPVYIDETNANFAVAWTGHYHLNGAAFIYRDRISDRVFTILGYPTDQISQLR